MGLNDGGVRPGGLRLASEKITSGTPDADVFQSPTFQFWAGESAADDGDTTDFPEVIAGADAEANNSPTLRKDLAQEYDAIEYAGGNEDYHTWESDEIDSPPWSVELLLYFDSLPEEQVAVLSWGDSSDEFVWNIETDGAVHMNSLSGQDPGFSAETLSDGEVQTCGFSYDGDSVDYYVNGEYDDAGGNISATADPDDGSNYIGRASTGGGYVSGYIMEVLVSDDFESDTEHSDYHSDRVS